MRLSIPDRWEVPIELWAYLVRYARRYRGVSQLALARAAGVTQQTISKVETGDIYPHDSLKVRISRALDVPTAALFPWPTQLVQTESGAIEWPVLTGGPSPEVSDA